jgi:hypothetical protein
LGVPVGIMGSTRPSHHVEVTTLREGYHTYPRQLTESSINDKKEILMK